MSCPICHGKRQFGPCHINRGRRQPHEWVNVPCPRCVGPADDPLLRLLQASQEEMVAAYGDEGDAPTNAGGQG